MRDSTKSLWAQTIRGVFKVIVFAVLAVVAIVLLPADTPKRIERFWRHVKREFGERNQPFRDFLTGKDMEKAYGQYEEFKGPKKDK